MKTKGIILIILAAIAAGIWPIIYRAIVPYGADPLSVAALRAYIAILVYLFFIIPHLKKYKIALKDIPFFTLYGLITITCLYVFYILAVDNLTSAMAVILLYTSPTFVILGSRLLYKEPITKVKVIAVLLTFMGCVLVVGLLELENIHISLLGVIMALLSGICFSLVTLLGRKVMGKYSAEVVSIMPSIFGSFFFLFIKAPWTIDYSVPIVTVGYLIIGVIGGACPRLGLIKGISLGVDGGDANVISTIEVIIGSLGGIIFMGDILSPLQSAGMFLVLVGAILPIYVSKNPQNHGKIKQENPI